ncbi:D-arabinose 1-dehydrogenase-like Zn-dependent alcohol dehydrogenase [Micromonospora pisi]|uniref:D-arabinose 1-dehydrogenase-like Zn-dependent alcohol dehydrogenase n=1 Tax=Micromonospora pisi TaxID=589240 RepID=A0A495JSU6_9ACTN|nr:alcohol dehydrogenase catalytic domain-containing protein [Micromonospora pisi]RKR92070.1 D-arabinose 1-dehydrogenase-like Zn-dependent alcohol dehydrogenase [Micromonospora pisi]
MRAFVVTGAHQSAVEEVEPPRAGPGQVVVDVSRVGICGTDIEFFTGEMAYLHQGHARYPMRLGHEWCGTVASVGRDVDPGWIGRRVTGDTMLGCGHCRRCRSGYGHVCADRSEIGIRGGFAGALAEQLAVPVTALHALPDEVDDTAGALVEPGGNALRSVQGAALEPGDRVLVLGPGTIGLLVAEFARAEGIEVHVVGKSPRSLEFARTRGFTGVWTGDQIPDLPWDAVIDAANDPALPARALSLVEPGRRVVYIGLAGTPSLVDTRTVALKDVTAVGILGGSAGLAGTIARYASGAVDPRPLVAATIGLAQVGAALAGQLPDDAGPGPKVHVDPRR